MRRFGSAPWFWLWLVLLAALLLTPMVPHWERGRAAGTPTQRDFVLNILVFVPLGLAFGRNRAGRAIVLALALTLTAEALQFWLPRSPDPWDLLANTLGAGVGLLLAGRLPDKLLRSLVRSRLWDLGLLLLIVIGGVIIQRGVSERRSNDFRDFQADFPLVLGTEGDGSRRWTGRLEELQVLPQALDAAGAQPGARRPEPLLHVMGGTPPSARLEGDARFLETPEGVTAEPGALRFEGGRLALPEAWGARLRERLAGASGLTLVARIGGIDPAVTGPGRIFTWSPDGGRRNLTLAQKGYDLVLRVRTEVSGPNGTLPQIRTWSEPLKDAGQSVEVVAIWDPHEARIYVDGRLEGVSCVARFAVPRLHGHYVLLIVVVVVAAAAWWVGRRGADPVTARRYAGIGGAAGFLGLMLLQAWSHLPRPWWDGVAALAAAAAVASVLPLLPRDRGADPSATPPP